MEPQQFFTALRSALKSTTKRQPAPTTSPTPPHTATPSKHATSLLTAIRKLGALLPSSEPPAAIEPGRSTACAAMMMRTARGHIWHVVIGYRLPNSPEIQLASFSRPADTAAERHAVNLEAFACLYQKLEVANTTAQSTHWQSAPPANHHEPTPAPKNIRLATFLTRHTTISRVASHISQLRHVLGKPTPQPTTTHDTAPPATETDQLPPHHPATVYVANNQLNTELDKLKRSFPAATFVRRSDFTDLSLLDAIEVRLTQPPDTCGEGNTPGTGTSGPRLRVATDASMRLHRAGAGLACVDQYGTWSTRYDSTIWDISVAEVASVSLALETFPNLRLELLVDSQTAVTWLTKRKTKVPRRARHLVNRTRKRLAKTQSTVTWVRSHSGHHLNETADRLARACRRDANFTDRTIACERGDWIVHDAFAQAKQEATPQHIDLRQHETKSLPRHS